MLCRMPHEEQQALKHRRLDDCRYKRTVTGMYRPVDASVAAPLLCSHKAWAGGLGGGLLVLLMVPGIGDYRIRLMLYYGGAPAAAGPSSRVTHARPLAGLVYLCVAATALLVAPAVKPKQPLVRVGGPRPVLTGGRHDLIIPPLQRWPRPCSCPRGSSSPSLRTHRYGAA